MAPLLHGVPAHEVFLMAGELPAATDGRAPCSHHLRRQPPFSVDNFPAALSIRKQSLSLVAASSSSSSGRLQVAAHGSSTRRRRSRFKHKKKRTDEPPAASPASCGSRGQWIREEIDLWWQHDSFAKPLMADGALNLVHSDDFRRVPASSGGWEVVSGDGRRWQAGRLGSWLAGDGFGKWEVSNARLKKVLSVEEKNRASKIVLRQNSCCAKMCAASKYVLTDFLMISWPFELRFSIRLRCWNPEIELFMLVSEYLSEYPNTSL